MVSKETLDEIEKIANTKVLPALKRKKQWSIALGFGTISLPFILYLFLKPHPLILFFVMLFFYPLCMFAAISHIYGYFRFRKEWKQLKKNISVFRILLRSRPKKGTFPMN
jgi:hypothetical protein